MSGIAAGNQGRTDAIPVGEGGQPGDVPIEQCSQRSSLRFAQLGELPSRVHHRAMVHAQLRTIAGHRLDGCSEALSSQVVGDCFDAITGNSAGSAGEYPLGPLGGEGRDSFTTLAPGKESQCLEGEGVVGLVARRTPGGGEGEEGTGSAPPWIGLRSEGGTIERLDQTRVLECTHGPTDGCWGDAQGVRDGRGRRGTPLSQQSRDSLGCFGREFHNTIVT